MKTIILAIVASVMLATIANAKECDGLLTIGHHGTLFIETGEGFCWISSNKQIPKVLATCTLDQFCHVEGTERRSCLGLDNFGRPADSNMQRDHTRPIGRYANETLSPAMQGHPRAATARA
jgi:hypothetical protein